MLTVLHASADYSRSLLRLLDKLV